jgi:2-phospho-L-lactate guanylyltransferase (CobY/MobA/RfbA family)
MTDEVKWSNKREIKDEMNERTRLSDFLKKRQPKGLARNGLAVEEIDSLKGLARNEMISMMDSEMKRDMNELDKDVNLLKKNSQEAQQGVSE